ncbi:glutamate mutase L [candidate division WOR-3 bacterium]|nr:glutamate mutase L [candidate division WOR-3 bacterium]
MKPKEQIKTILATDCGSTTTKAILIQKDDKVGRYRLIVRGEAPTTVESPFEDVTIGVLNSVKEVEELVDRKILENDKIIKDRSESEGVDIYISTSSAGGGLQMMVAGVVKNMTAESAARAALGAGSIVMDVIATNDKRLPHQRIERIRNLRPDMILLSGGIDGGTTKHVAELAELIAAADPKPRFGSTFKLPVIFAGNKDARGMVEERLKEKTELFIVDNLRPILERENLKPARDKIHDLFMEHVMAQAPGYRKLMSWTDVSIMPTPGAVGLLIETVAKQENIQVIGVDIGGATTDVFSVFVDKTEKKPVFNRTVSANLGMSYSISNVMAEAGIPNIMRWVPFKMDEKDLRNRIRNKMIRPTTIPQTLEELKVEQAIAREALRLAFIQHKFMAVGLKGVQQERTISDAFDQAATGVSLVDMMNLNMLIGSGGVLSHAPRRAQSALMMIDAFLPEGVTLLAVDSIFMMPHLGVLSTVHPEAATEVFDNDCLIRLGHCIAPVEKKKKKPGDSCLHIKFESGREESVEFGTLKLFEFPEGKKEKAVLYPDRNFDLGAGFGKEIETVLEGGVVGLIVDTRGRRPFEIAKTDEERINKLSAWNKALNIYPDER